MIENGGTFGGVPLPNVTGNILAKVLEYCNKPTTVIIKEELKEFNEVFVDVDRATLLQLILAANYLDMKRLLDIASHKVADSIKDKSSKEIMDMFNIQNDFTPEENAETHRENAWAFE
ncbi:unnamed protein product [Urochloa humidicola]